MFKFLRRIERCVIASVFGFALAGPSSLAQDPVKIAPNNYKVPLENDSVRVCNVQVKAGEEIAMHSHPDHLVYAINGGKSKFTFPDGKTKDVELKAGDATWIKAETHAGENVGTTELKLVVFELRKPTVAGSKPKALPADEQLKVAPESTKLLLDNDRVRLLDIHLKGGGKLAKHSHPAYVSYGVSGVKFKVTASDGKTVEKSVAAGEATWNEPTTHTVDNAGTDEAHVVVLELKE